MARRGWRHPGRPDRTGTANLSHRPVGRGHAETAGRPGLCPVGAAPLAPYPRAHQHLLWVSGGGPAGDHPRPAAAPAGGPETAAAGPERGRGGARCANGDPTQISKWSRSAPRASARRASSTATSMAASTPRRRRYAARHAQPRTHARHRPDWTTHVARISADACTHAHAHTRTDDRVGVCAQVMAAPKTGHLGTSGSPAAPPRRPTDTADVGDGVAGGGGACMTGHGGLGKVRHADVALHPHRWRCDLDVRHHRHGDL